MEETPLKQILVVDDEINIVKAVQRELHASPSLRHSFKAETFTSPAEALARAREKAFDAVISDYRMPGMDGVEFLNALAALQPDCVPIVLSGQTDMEGLLRMINETRIYHFVPKPWQEHHLRSVLSQALDHAAALLENRRLAALVRGQSLLALPIRQAEADQVLIVDDDAGVLRSLARILAQHAPVDDALTTLCAGLPPEEPQLPAGGLQLHLAASASEALALAEGIDFSCAIADLRMPGMSGLDLLQRLSTRQPDCMRILISGQIAQEELVRAVGDAHIFAFLDKPWTEFEVKKTVALALAHRRIGRENLTLARMVRPG